MQYSRGLKHFDFVPQTFILPAEINELVTSHYRHRGAWIVKPIASSRGRGIYLVNSVIISQCYSFLQFFNLTYGCTFVFDLFFSSPQFPISWAFILSSFDVPIRPNNFKITSHPKAKRVNW